MSALDALFSLVPGLGTGAKILSTYAMVRCPFHGGGNENTPSCSISALAPVFYCHSCLEQGHISRIFRLVGIGRDHIDRILRSNGMGGTHGPAGLGSDIKKNVDLYRGTYVLDDVILDTYRLAPVQLLEAGFQKEVLRHFEVGFDHDNLRITYPLRNVYGQLVGISGRAALEEIEPRYKIYDSELKRRGDIDIPEGYSMERTKEAVLWHAHVVRPFLYKNNDPIILTEGFKACMWTYQAGYHNVTALVGLSLTKPHAELIATAVQRVYLFLDNNRAGRLGTFIAGDNLVRVGREVLVMKYPDSREQPDALYPFEIAAAFEQAEPYIQWRDQNGRQYVHENENRRKFRRAQR